MDRSQEFSRRRSRAFAPGLAVLAGVALLAAGCGGEDDDNPAGPSAEVPAAWAGIWETTTVVRDCVTDELLFESTEPDTMCAGEPISFEDEGFEEIACEGTVTDTSIDVTCTTSFPSEGLSYEVSITFEATRTGDSYSGTGRIQFRVNGVAVDCSDFEISGSRTGPAPEDCTGSPARPAFVPEFVRRATARR